MQKVTEVTFNETVGDYNKEIYVSGEVEDVARIICTLKETENITLNHNVTINGNISKDTTEEHCKKIRELMKTANSNM